MTIVEDPKLGSIDSMFDEDHFVCCTVAKDFVGVTKAFCGDDTILDGSDQEWVEEVGCQKCNDIANKDVWYCPLGYDCKNTDLEEDNA